MENQYIKLPKPAKKVLYLDQFVYSNLRLVLDTANPRHSKLDPFWAQFYNLLNEAQYKQAVICPRTTIHMQESVVTSFYDDLIRINEKLSHNCNLRSIFEIQKRQLCIVLRAIVSGNDPNLELQNRSLAYYHDYDVWIPRLTISMTATWYKENADVYREDRINCGTGLSRICDKWRSQPDRNFMYWVKNESEGYIKSMRQKFGQRIEAQLRGDFEQAFITAHPLSDALPCLFETARKLHSTDDEAWRCVSDFLTVDNMLKVPYVRVQSMLYAGMAHKVATGQKQFADSISNDVHAVSAILPYCDAMFIDSQFASLLRDEPLKSNLGWSPMLFHNRAKSREELLCYLQNCIDEVPEAVQKAVNEVYNLTPG